MTGASDYLVHITQTVAVLRMPDVLFLLIIKQSGISPDLYNYS